MSWAKGEPVPSDVLVHDDVYPGITPGLELYDTTFDGIVNANDPARAIDRIETTARLRHLGHGKTELRKDSVPHHADLFDHVFESRGWQAGEYRAYRCQIDYPLYGSQVVVAFG